MGFNKRVGPGMAGVRKALAAVGSGLLMAAAFSPVTMAQSSVQGYLAHPQAKAFMQQMIAEEGFTEAELNSWFAQAEKKQSILDAISRPAEKTKPWSEYQDIFLTPSRVQKGVQFWQQNKVALDRAQKEFGVPAEVIVAIIGVETGYGSFTGNYRVLDALSTLAFDYPPRSPFFTNELRQFLLLSREQKQSPLMLKGSYAGAMGYGQFMPSSYRAYAVDYTGDQFVDIWKNPTDAIGSVANYFVKHGWRGGEPVVERAKVKSNFDATVVNDDLKPLHTVASLKDKGFKPQSRLPGSAEANVILLDGKQGEEYWIGLNNFYAITRYNHSRMYAMAVHQLSQQLRQSMAK